MWPSVPPGLSGGQPPRPTFRATRLAQFRTQKNIPTLRCVAPDGAFYAFVNWEALTVLVTSAPL
jgi:hypothetical protein